MSAYGEDSAQAKRDAWRQNAIIAVVVVVVLTLLGWGLQSLLSGKNGTHKKPPRISLIPTAPPPPPPPPKEEKKPEPPKEQKEMKMEQPQQVQKVEAPAPAPELKMEGAAGDGPSAFAAGTVTSEDISKLGSDKGLFNPFNNYAGLLKVELQQYLRKNKELRERQYHVDVRVWVSADGSLKRSELMGSTGDADTDTAIRHALTSTPIFSEPPPANMPQPIRLRIVTTGRA